MAKEKKVLTPEEQEIKSMKKAKRSQNWLKFWAILLALVITAGVVYAGKTTGEKMKPVAAEGTQTANNNSADAGETKLNVENQVSEGEEITLGNGEVVVGLSQADAIKLVNEATAAATKASYKWDRDCQYIENVSVGSATLEKILNGVINGIDEGSDMNSVVGGFIGIGTKTGKVNNGAFAKDDKGDTPDSKYLIQAFKLTDADVSDYAQSGNVYIFSIKSCANPQKDGSNAISHVTQDFITKKEVDKSIADFTSAITVNDTSTVDYTNIKVEATISEGKLTNLVIEYDFKAKLDLNVKITTMTGTGSAHTKIVYSDIA